MRITTDFNTEIFAVTTIYREGEKMYERITKIVFPPIFLYSSVLCGEIHNHLFI